MKLRPFEIGLVVFFIIAAILGLVLVSNYKQDDKELNPYGTSVVIWGAFDSVVMNDFFYSLSNQDQGFKVVRYVQVDPRTFDNELVNAIAEGESPDLIILPHTKLVAHRSKLEPISFETISERTFRDAYLDGAEIFIGNNGIYGIPIAVDPLVMFWNRDIFSTSGLSRPPKTWDVLMSQTTKAITLVDSNRSVTRSTVAFGEYSNVLHAKEVLSMLFLQAGSSIVEETGGYYRVTLNDNIGNTYLRPGDAVLNFYSQFAISNKELYSWNRAKQLDRKEFLKGDLGLYFGLGSEYSTLERDNVNLNFDIAVVPQDSDATILRNYADFYAFAIPRGSDNKSGAYLTALKLASPALVQQITDVFGMVPAVRSLHPSTDTDPVKNVTYSAALISRGWLDPNPIQSAAIFQNMVERVTSGRARVESAISDAVIQLEKLY